MNFQEIVFVSLMISSIGADNSTNTDLASTTGISSGEDSPTPNSNKEMIMAIDAFTADLTNAMGQFDISEDARLHEFADFVEGLIEKDVIIQKLTEKREVFNDLVENLTERFNYIYSLWPSTDEWDWFLFGIKSMEFIKNLSDVKEKCDYLLEEVKKSTCINENIRGILYYGFVAFERYFATAKSLSVRLMAIIIRLKELYH